MTEQGYVDSEVVVTAFDHFCATIRQKTVVLLDNASIHTSDTFKRKAAEWEKNGLFVKYLPTYSPELNLTIPNVDNALPGKIPVKLIPIPKRLDELAQIV